jgi:hypothetical protein
MTEPQSKPTRSGSIEESDKEKAVRAQLFATPRTASRPVSSSSNGLGKDKEIGKDSVKESLSGFVSPLSLSSTAIPSSPPVARTELTNSSEVPTSLLHSFMLCVFSPL